MNTNMSSPVLLVSHNQLETSQRHLSGLTPNGTVVTTPDNRDRRDGTTTTRTSSETPLPEAVRPTSDSISSRSDHEGSSRSHAGEALTDSDITVTRRVRHTSESSTETSQIYLSVLHGTGKLGAAYYDIDTSHIYMLPDAQENENFALLKRLIQQLHPCCVVTSAKQDDRMLKVLKSQDGQSEEMGGITLENDLVHLLPSIDYSRDICKRRVLSVHLPTIPDHYTETERTLHISSIVPFENTNMVCALGGLLKYLEKNRIGIELEDADAHVPVLALQLVNMDIMVIIDENSYSALQIFRKESHPSVYKTGSGKEGLSLFGIMNRCHSQIGSAKLREWFVQPLKDRKKIEERLEAVSFFINPRNMEITMSLIECLKSIKNVSKILSRMQQAQATLGGWQALYKTAYNAIYIGDICRSQAVNIELFKKIGETFTEDLHRIANLISKIVDFEESAIQNRFVVKQNVDSELDKKKRTYNGLPDFMSKVAREELNKLSEDIKECNIIYLPQLGYLLAIPESEEVSGDQPIPGLEFQFKSNNMIHYKSARTRELDSLLGDTQCDITDHETSIMHRLQDTILEHSSVLLDVMNYAAQLDCLIALAVCAREGNYNRPQIVNEPMIDIKGGRHPLQELCCSPFVPNDTVSGGEHPKMTVLTGPNSSGKSVYLKQVALIVFMAHIGSYVPADAATIGLVDAIFTRIRTLESVSVGLSTFMIDLNQVSLAIGNATERSLVILDEFGKGTETVDGIALLSGVLRHWLKQEVACPHVLVSTHFHSIVTQQLLPPNPQLKYQTMEVLQDGPELVFLYQLVEGTTNTSYACHIATQAGLPNEIVTRGMEVSELLRQNKPVHRVDTASTQSQLQRCETIVNRFLNLDLENTDPQVFLKDFVLQASKGLSQAAT